MRGTSRVINAMLMSLGAHPVAMPVIAVTEALPKGTIDGTVLPFEITAQLNIPKLAPTQLLPTPELSNSFAENIRNSSKRNNYSLWGGQ